MAHDFNNILTGILGSVELLRFRDDLPADVKPDLEAIQKLSKRAATLVRQVLDFSRKSLVDMRPLDLAVVVAESLEMLRRTISEKIKMLFTQEPGRYMVEGDLVSIQSVLTNMAVNSQDAIHGDGEISFRLSRLELQPGADAPCEGMAPGAWVVLAVSDTGSGIPPDALPYIFEPFFTTKGVGQGTGLGLAQAFGIVKRMQGFIRADSPPGSGAAITIYLPALDPGEPGAGDVREAARAVLPLPGKDKRLVLLVEDEDLVRKIARRLLESLGYQVLAAENGDAALALFEPYKDEVVLVLTDMTMPGMNGLKLIQELKARSPGIRSIVMSGYPLKDIAEQSLKDLGVAPDAWLPKPLGVGALGKLISDVLGRA
jgi:CheY-like chemotaxis protein